MCAGCSPRLPQQLCSRVDTGDWLVSKQQRHHYVHACAKAVPRNGQCTGSTRVSKPASRADCHTSRLAARHDPQSQEREQATCSGASSLTCGTVDSSNQSDRSDKGSKHTEPTEPGSWRFDGPQHDNEHNAPWTNGASRNGKTHPKSSGNTMADAGEPVPHGSQSSHRPCDASHNGSTDLQTSGDTEAGASRNVAFLARSGTTVADASRPVSTPVTSNLDASVAAGIDAPQAAQTKPSWQRAVADRLYNFVPWRTQYDKQIVDLAIPAVLALAADPLLSLVDTAFVGRLGSDELAALGVNTALFSFAFLVFNFLATASTPLIATALATDNRQQVCSHLLPASVFIPHPNSVHTCLSLSATLSMEGCGFVDAAC